MATTIGRAGKQLFATIQIDPNDPNAGAMISPKPTPSRETSNLSISTPCGPLTSSNKVRRKSKDTLDLENTLEECINLASSADEFIPTPRSARSDKSPMFNSSQKLTPSYAPKASPRDPLLRSFSNLPSSSTHNSSNKQLVSSPYKLSKQATESVLPSEPVKIVEESKPTDDAIDLNNMNKEELMAALEVLKMQNQMLTNKVQKTQLDSIRQIEKERAQRLVMIHNLEKENQSLLSKMMEQKLAAEQKLENEKLLFIERMQAMELEKSSLERNLSQIQEKNSEEMGYFLMQKYELEKRMQGLLLEKEKFIKSHEVNSTMLLEDQEKLAKLEQDKLLLMQQLQDHELKTREQNIKLKEEMQSLQSTLKEKANIFESTKTELTSKLQSTEKLVQQQNDAMQIQLEKQQQQSLDMMKQLEDEKLKLMAFANSDENDGNDIAGDTNNSGRAPLKHQLTANTAAQIQEMIDEKDTLQNRLKQSAEQAKVRVKEIKERLMKKQKKKLGQQVHKMKELIKSSPFDDDENDPVTTTISEKMSFLGSFRSPQSKDSGTSNLLSPGNSQKQANGLPTGGNLHPTSGSKGKLTPKKSLFDLLTTSDGSTSGQTNPASVPSSSGAVNPPTGTAPSSSSSSSGSLPNNNAYEVISSQNIYSPAVPPKDTVPLHEKTFMDLDDDEDSDNEGKQQKSTSSPVKQNKPIEESKSTKQMMTTSLSQQQEEVSYATSQQQKQQESYQENKEIVIESNANADHDLPAPHIAAANNQLSKLQIYYNLDDELLYSLDNVSRQPIFYAAANGHLDILKYFASLCQHNPSKLLDILYHVDSYGDCLLHAVSSSGNIECVQFLLDTEHELLNSKFVSTKHSIASSSSSLQLGQQQPQASKLVTIKNSTGMTATHLAHDDNVLSVLAGYGSNMNAKDYYQRTPLFIACAMNKASCVEYFIANGLDINEENENILLIKDYRGDTPLHAAACNNSVESLLQLLQCGIDPRLMNQQGLKAIDLAIRNKHFKCQQILAEYYLHYCTSSEFDSVLFLAALEGHRAIAQAKQQAKHTLLTTPTPLNNQPPSSTRTMQDKLNPLAKNSQGVQYQSMFTLRDNSTMRLQRYGCWIAYYDPTGTNNIFWYHSEKCVGQWETPEEVKEYRAKEEHLAAQQAATTAASSHTASTNQLNRLAKAFENANSTPDQKMNKREEAMNKTLEAKMSMRIKRHGEWIQYTADGGKTFYYNEKNGMFQWHNPFDEHGNELSPLNMMTAAGTVIPSAAKGGTTGATETAGEDEEEYETIIRVDDDSHRALSASDKLPSFSGIPTTASHSPKGLGGSASKKKQRLPSYYTDWKPYVDEGSQEIFWYNNRTKMSQWENPFEQLQQEADRLNEERLQREKENESFYHPKAAAITSTSSSNSGIVVGSNTATMIANRIIEESEEDIVNENRTSPRKSARRQQQQQSQSQQPRAPAYDDIGDGLVYAVYHENDLGI